MNINAKKLYEQMPDHEGHFTPGQVSVVYTPSSFKTPNPFPYFAAKQYSGTLSEIRRTTIQSVKIKKVENPIPHWDRRIYTGRMINNIFKKYL